MEKTGDSAGALAILVVEDEASLRRAIALNLNNAGFSVREISTATETFPIIEKEQFDIILCDLRLPDIDGFEFIRRCHETCPQTAIVTMTAFGSTDLALKAMRAGAYDYLSKPFEMDELVLMLHKIEEREQLRVENERLRSDIQQRYTFANIVAQSDVMRDIFETVKRLADFSTTVLITGESGTGKELLARAIHHNSPRRGKPFIAINCGAIPENLMESELFGHRKGAFTDATRDKRGLFEEANGGTIFLDEVGEMPLHLQVKLLRALQERQVRRVGDEELIPIDIRLVAATLRDLEVDVDKGRFRDDLFYRLNVVSIDIPPLRERPEDIPLLIEHFLKKHNKKLGLSIQKVTPEAMKQLTRYHWRGNVRELENCIERALVLTDTGSIDLDSLPDTVQKAGSGGSPAAMSEPIAEDDLSIKKRGRALEIDLIVKALRRTSGNRTHAAKILEISHRALLYKLKEYSLTEFEKGEEADES